MKQRTSLTAPGAAPLHLPPERADTTLYLYADGVEVRLTGKRARVLRRIAASAYERAGLQVAIADRRMA